MVAGFELDSCLPYLGQGGQCLQKGATLLPSQVVPEKADEEEGKPEGPCFSVDWNILGGGKWVFFSTAADGS